MWVARLQRRDLADDVVEDVQKMPVHLATETAFHLKLRLPVLPLEQPHTAHRQEDEEFPVFLGYLRVAARPPLAC